MVFYADLHIHSKHSRATSRDCDLEHLAWWARRKGITVVATGDFTHPAWFDELRDKLVPAEPGLFRLRPEIEAEVERRLPGPCRGPVRFLLEVEISTIYKKGDRTRKVHHLLYAAGFDTAAEIRRRLGEIGNLASDGRPILGLDSRDLLEITLESGPDAYLIPAHIWTPWFAVLGSKSGFDSVEECYGDLAGHIFAVETGLSSDPPMNWRLSQLDRFRLVSNSDAHSPPRLGREACAFDTELDYFALRRALETGEGFAGTVEFFPEEGKYHMDGHRACGVRLEPGETRRAAGACPSCGKPVTVGVMHRVDELADRPDGDRRPTTSPFHSLVPLPEVLGEIHGVGPKSRTVERAASALVSRLGPEMDILERLPLEEVATAADPLLVEALERLRAGRVRREAGYDGEYGVIRLFEPGELERRAVVAPLFEMPEEAAKTTADPRRDRRDAAPLPPRDSPPPPSGEGTPPGPSRSSPLLTALDPEQRAAAEAGEGPLLILAGPGTGKTRTLTHRLAHLVRERGVPAGHCLAVTFSRRAAAEMAERLAVLLGEAAAGVTVETFHGLGLRLLREHAAAAGLSEGFRVATEEERAGLLGRIADLTPRQARRRLEEISRHRRGQGSADGPAASSESEHAAAYVAALRQRGLVDFDDLLLLSLALLEEHPDLALAWRERFAWIFVDEYQDIDPLQYRLVRLLAPAGDANLCAIGDPDQSIYRFRGADVGFFLRFREDYPAARRVELHRNYRSTTTIVRAAMAAIRPASLEPERRLTAEQPDPGAALTLHEAASEAAEAEFVAATIEGLLGGTSYFSLDSGRVAAGPGETEGLSFADFAVLYRAGSQAAPLLEALGRAGIPCQQHSHRPLAERPGVALLLRALDGTGHGGGEIPDLGGGSVEARLERAARHLLTTHDAGSNGPARATVTAAVELLRPLATASGDDVDAFVAAVALDSEVDIRDPRAERVSLLTLHAAKGLEFPVVFLVGCEEGRLPLSFSDAGEPQAENLAEERRLFFVGLTRARSRLFLSHTRRRGPSPFLADLPGSLLARHAAPAAKRRPAEQLKLF